MVLNKQFIGVVIESIKKQGLPFLLLLAAIFYMNTQISNLQQQIIDSQKKSDACRQEIINMYKEERKEMIDAINKNTQAFELFTGKKTS